MRITSSILTGLKQALLSKILSSSFRSWYRHWPQVLLAVIVDFLFVVATSTVITLIQFTLFEHLEALMKLAGEMTGGLANVFNQTAEVSAGMIGLPNNVDFQYHLNIIVKYLGIMVLSTLVLWILFQGISWFLAYRISEDPKRRLPFLIFWKNFAVQTVPFYALFVLWMFLYIRILFAIKMSIAPWMGADLLDFFFVLLTVLTCYFGALSYTITTKYSYRNFKQSFVFGTSKLLKVAQSVIAITILFILIDLFFRIPFIAEDPILMIVLGTIIFMPAVTYARIVLFRTRQAYWPIAAAKAKKK